MKIRLTLIALIVAAQIGWLTFNYISNCRILDSAPRILVKAESRWDSIRVCDDYFDCKLDPANPRIGKSIRWVIPETDSTAASSRTAPAEGDDVKGAITFTFDQDGHCHTIEIDGKEVKRDADFALSAIWSKGENGIWDYRLEAPGSSEDVLRDGELRTSARWGYIHTSDKVVSLHLHLFRVRSYPAFEITRDTNRLIRHHKIASDSEHLLTMELALREGMPALATQVFYDGIPWSELIRDLKHKTERLPEEEDDDDEELQLPLPESPATAEQPAESTAEQPEAPAAEQPAESTAEQPEAPATEQPAESTAEQPEAPATEQPAESTAEQPETPAAE